MVNKAIIFIPGIGGSNLYSIPDNKKIYLTKGFFFDGRGEQFFVYDDWEERDYELFSDPNPTNLIAKEMIREEDINISPEIFTYGPKPLAFSATLSHRAPGYDKTIEFFKKRDWSIRKRMKSWKLPEGDSEDQDAFFEIPYDWRLDIDDIVPVLYNLINSHVVSGREIYLIGHSTGGLISRAFLRSYQYHSIYNNIKGQILMGTPNHGAPKAYWILRSGRGFLTYEGVTWLFNYGSGIPSNLHNLMYRLPLPYQLLPSEHYENFFFDGPVYGPIVTVKGDAEKKIEGTYFADKTNIFKKETHLGDVPDADEAAKWYSLGNKTLVRQALSFHKNLSQKTYLPDKTHIIYSSEIDTLTGVHFRKTPGEDGDPIIQKVGDGAVPAASVYDLKDVYYHSTDFKTVEHGELPLNRGVLEHVLEIITA